MPTNEMTLAKAFRDAGIEQDKAEHLATTIFAAIRDNVATKADIDVVRSETREMEQRINLKLAKLEQRLTVGGAGTLVTGLTLLFAALHYWPPHG
jgi:hypothetical protein